jgi:hypothetical protein
MPILENSPWRRQYFEGVACPDGVTIPTDDDVAYVLYPAHRWVYNKLLICETQGIAHAPHGISPARFPVFSKPIYNLRGMGAESRILASPAEYERWQRPGHLWMELLAGEHVSSDVAVIAGECVWWRHAVGQSLGHGLFDYWTVLAEPMPAIETYCAAWITRHLRTYSGVLNLETIGARIIEAHLRFTDQWPDLYGPGWIDSLVGLYSDHRWRHPTAARRTGYSVVLFADRGQCYRMIEDDQLAALRTAPAISSIQITFHADRPPEAHAMPPGGFRLAIINCWDLEAGFAVRRRLTQLFAAKQIEPGASTTMTGSAANTSRVIVAAGDVRA